MAPDSAVTLPNTSQPCRQKCKLTFAPAWLTCGSIACFACSMSWLIFNGSTTACLPLLANSSMSFTCCSKSCKRNINLSWKLTRESSFNFLFRRLAPYNMAADNGVRIWWANFDTIRPKDDRRCNCPNLSCNNLVSVKSVIIINCPGWPPKAVISNFTRRPSFNETSCQSSARGLKERLITSNQGCPKMGSSSNSFAVSFIFTTTPLPSRIIMPVGITSITCCSCLFCWRRNANSPA